MAKFEARVGNTDPRISKIQLIVFRSRWIEQPNTKVCTQALNVHDMRMITAPPASGLKPKRTVSLDRPDGDGAFLVVNMLDDENELVESRTFEIK